MKRNAMKLNIFDGEAAPAAQPSTPAAASQEPAKAPPASAAYSYAQAEEIATARAERAEKAALASFFKQQGMTEQEATEAIKAYKAAKKAKEPDVAAITKERDEALAKLEARDQKDALAAKGVKPEFAGFVAFSARELMAKDDKLDTFEKAAEKFLKDNPQYASARKQAYKVRTSADQGSSAPSGGAPGKAMTEAEKNAAANAALRSFLRGK